MGRPRRFIATFAYVATRNSQTTPRLSLSTFSIEASSTFPAPFIHYLDSTGLD